MEEYGSRGTVLLVESDAQERERVATGLEDAGFNVTLCPGPSGPDYTCVGARTLECPLAKGASVVVLDMWLEGVALMEGTPAEEPRRVLLRPSSDRPRLAPRRDPPGGACPDAWLEELATRFAPAPRPWVDVS
jgi:hypothetical protein